MARPTLLTPERHMSIVQALKLGLTRKAAANIAGVTDRTLRSWLEVGRTSNDEDDVHSQFLADVESAEANVEQMLTASIIKAARGTEDRFDKDGKLIARGRPGDYRAAQFWLERRRAEYRQRTDVNVNTILDDVLDAVERVCGRENAERILSILAAKQGEGATGEAES